MQYTNVDKIHWKSFFEFVSRRVVGNQIELESASVEFGHQIEVDWQPILDLSYSPSDDVIYLIKDDLDHVIPDPQEVVLVESDGAVRSVCIKNAEGQLQILQFREPLLLEAPMHFSDAPF